VLAKRAVAPDGVMDTRFNIVPAMAAVH